jgi:hypothetical protein
LNFVLKNKYYFILKYDLKKYEQNVSKILPGTGSFTSLAPLSMQDIKLNATTTLIDQSMSPYHAGEDAFFGARRNYGKEAQFCSQHKYTQIKTEIFLHSTITNRTLVESNIY